MSPALPPLPPALARWIAGGIAPAGVDWTPEVLEVLQAHGVDGLAAVLDPGAAGAPPEIDAALRLRRAALVAAELRSEGPLRAALEAMRGAGIDCLLIKGEALARTHYVEPGTRVRGDADVWPCPGSFDAAANCLQSLGWHAVAACDGEWLQPERSYLAPMRAARIDLHRRVLSQPLLAAAMPYRDLRARARTVDGIAVPADADALLLAALHLVGHHAGAPRAIWLFDLHRLATAQVLSQAATIALATNTAGVFAHALRMAQTCFGTALDADVMHRLASAGTERSAALTRPLSRRARLWLDFCSLPDRRARATWLRELILPDARWLRATEGSGPLLWLYLRRAWHGWRSSR